ncbi:YqiA/YcfP family alpha/beta fold hydrolase [Psychrobacter pygoscelis]|uniref:YqiA/YcfP family alpha/beta fold hydrolase n=1 Tax=Psychrobacter pygoscelis TaxID=2488563 RepID=UPI00103ECE43|nr:YqiA/YcfP family alpha/beta fold hydrolase [Psychrobacter pygoscelis]
MKIIYVHGLDSSANSMKGLLLEQYCQHNHPDIEVIRPDLNAPPYDVFQTLVKLVSSNTDTVLMGSSLGGYFSSLVSNHTGCPAILLNPSIQPHVSLQRFLKGQNPDNKASIIYQTAGGWHMSLAHLQWFAEHQLTQVDHPKRLLVLIKAGDELLNPQIATDFYRSQGVEVILQPNGDHRMTDFELQLPILMQKLPVLSAQR